MENMGVVSYKSALEDAKKDKMGLLCVSGRSDPSSMLMSRNDDARKKGESKEKTQETKTENNYI